MSTRGDLPFTQWAGVHQTDKFTCVEPLSGYRRTLREDNLYGLYLDPGATEEVFGRALLEALNRSRFICPPTEREFFEADRIMRNYRKWQKYIMDRYGYKSKHQAYKNMTYCVAERCEGKISIKPHRRDKPELWTDLPADRTVVIPATTDPVTAGAAQKLALSRCE